jgi:hypothetical protein
VHLEASTKPHVHRKFEIFWTNIASTMACPNFKNGPKNGLGPLGINNMQLCQKSIRKNDNLVIQKSYNFFISNVKNEVIKIGLQAAIPNRYRLSMANEAMIGPWAGRFSGRTWAIFFKKDPMALLLGAGSSRPCHSCGLNHDLMLPILSPRSTQAYQRFLAMATTTNNSCTRECARAKKKRLHGIWRAAKA